MSELVLQEEFGKVLLFLLSHGYNGSRVHHSCQIPLESEQVPPFLVTSCCRNPSLFSKAHTTVQSGAHYLEFISNGAFESRNKPIRSPESGHMTKFVARKWKTLRFTTPRQMSVVIKMRKKRSNRAPAFESSQALSS